MIPPWGWKRSKKHLDYLCRELKMPLTSDMLVEGITEDTSPEVYELAYGFVMGDVPQEDIQQEEESLKVRTQSCWHTFALLCQMVTLMWTLVNKIFYKKCNPASLWS
jgi:MoaA/NifB/PqqE/SkfB family radical SAM enzyme